MNNQEVLEVDTSCQDEEMPQIRHFHVINRSQRGMV